MRKFDLNYDDYQTEPSVEDCPEIHRQLVLCFKNHPENFKWISMMLIFRDHGYRLLPSSPVDQFYLNDPADVDQTLSSFPPPLAP